MRENFVRQIAQRGPLLTSPGFGIDVPDNWLIIPQQPDGQKIVALSVGARSDADKYIIETADYKGSNALLLSLAVPLVGPFTPPINIRPYYCFDAATNQGYEAEIHAWTDLPRAYAERRADKVLRGRFTTNAGGVYFGAQPPAAGTGNIAVWTMGRRILQLAVYNDTGANQTVTVEAATFLSQNLIDPLNVSQAPIAAVTFDTAYATTGAFATGTWHWQDVTLVGNPLVVFLKSTNNGGAASGNIWAQVTLKDDV
jgi:hypothetical protein